MLVLGLAISVERYVYLTLAKTNNQQLWNKLMPMLKEGKYRQFAADIAKSKTAINHIFSYGLSHARTTRRLDKEMQANQHFDLEITVRDSGIEVCDGKGRLIQRIAPVASGQYFAQLSGLLRSIK